VRAREEIYTNYLYAAHMKTIFARLKFVINFWMPAPAASVEEVALNIVKKLRQSPWL